METIDLRQTDLCKKKKKKGDFPSLCNQREQGWAGFGHAAAWGVSPSSLPSFSGSRVGPLLTHPGSSHRKKQLFSEGPDSVPSRFPRL